MTGYLADGTCYKTDLAAAQALCSSWHSAHMGLGFQSFEYCYKAYTPSVGVAGLTIVFRNVTTSSGGYTDSYQGPWITLMPCDYVEPSASTASSGYRATNEEYQAVTVIFSSVLVALCVVWGFRQIIKIFATHPEA